MVLFLFQLLLLMLRWLLMHQRLKKSLSLWLLTKSTRVRARFSLLFLEPLLTLGARHHLSQGLPLFPRLWPLAQSQRPLRPSKPRWHYLLFPWPPSLSPRLSHLLRLSKPMSSSRLQGLLLPHLMRTFCTCCSLRKHFPTFLRLLLFPCTRPA